MIHLEFSTQHNQGLKPNQRHNTMTMMNTQQVTQAATIHTILMKRTHQSQITHMDYQA